MTPLLDACRAGLPLTCKLLLEAGADVAARDEQENTCVHWCARKGWGSMIKGVLKIAEKVKPGSTNGILTARNVKQYTPSDVAPNVTVQNLISREIKRYGAVEEKRQKTRNKMKKGLLKAKFMGADIGQKKLAAIKAKQRRYTSAHSPGKIEKKMSATSDVDSFIASSNVPARMSITQATLGASVSDLAGLSAFTYERR